MKKVLRLNESDFKRLVKRIVNEVTGPEVKVTPKIPNNLGFKLQDSPTGKVLNWKTDQPQDSPIANTKIIIEPGANIKVVKKGQIQIEGYLYFAKGSGKSGEKSTFAGEGPESIKAILGKSIKKTIWYDCKTGSFYLWYDTNKVEYSFYGRPMFNKFTETQEWIGKSVCGYANQDEMLAQFKS